MRIVSWIGAAIAAFSWISAAVAEPDLAPAEQPAQAVPASTADVADKKEMPAAAPKPVTTLAIDIDLTRQQLTVSTGGKQLHRWSISSGTAEFPTPRGTFRPQWMAKMWHSRKYDDAPMPHSIFFHGGAAIHATSSTGRLGSPASHGCVRLAPANAATLYGLVTRHGMASTRIVVQGQPKYHAPQVAQRRDRDRDQSAQRIQIARTPVMPRGYVEAYRYAAPMRPVQYAPYGVAYYQSAPRYAPPGYGRYPSPQLIRY